MDDLTQLTQNVCGYMCVYPHFGVVKPDFWGVRFPPAPFHFQISASRAVTTCAPCVAELNFPVVYFTRLRSTLTHAFRTRTPAYHHTADRHQQHTRSGRGHRREEDAARAVVEAGREEQLVPVVPIETAELRDRAEIIDERIVADVRAM